MRIDRKKSGVAVLPADEIFAGTWRSSFDGKNRTSVIIQEGEVAGTQRSAYINLTSLGPMAGRMRPLIW
jgi:hypothetical protein